MNLSQAQLEELRQIVADHHSALIVNTISPEALPKETVDRLKAAGLYKPEVESIRDAYLTGVVTSQLPAQGETMSYAQLRARLKANPIPLSRAEQQAVKVAELSAGQYITALGQRVAAQAGTMVMQADTQARAEDLGIIRTEVSRAVRTRRSIKQLKSDLGHATKDWARDLERVANTEMSTALQQGVALAGSAREGDKTRAAKRFAPDCCFVPGTLVETDRGARAIESLVVGDRVLTHRLRYRRVTEVMQRAYKGSLIGINGAPCATEDHPYLVDMSWQSADSVKKGAKVVRLIGRVDPDDDPAITAQNRLFAAISLSDSAATVPRASVQLYRDLLLTESDVDVVSLNSKLRNRVQISQPLAKSAGLLRHLSQAFLPSVSGSLKSLMRAGGLDPLPSRQRPLKPLLLRSVLFPESVLLRRAPNPDTIPFEAKTDNVGAYAKGFCHACYAASRILIGLFNGLSIESGALSPSLAGAPALSLLGGVSFAPSPHRHALLEKQPAHSGGAEAHPLTHLLQGQPFTNVQAFSQSCVQSVLKTAHQADLTEVTDVVHTSYSGQVYNLSVEEDQSYFADHHAVHNCNHCRDLYSVGGSSVPKVFLLSELVANGTNVGRKAKDWLPVIGPVHPNCGCSLVIVPAGMSYTANGDLLPDDDTP